MSFEKIKGKLGFGCMRLKMDGEQVNYTEFSSMIDEFISSGFNYFDTAHGYIDGKSETAIRDCLAARYPREAYVLTDKLSEWYIKEEDDILPYFENQLRCCGVDYFDIYLLHAVGRGNYEKYKSCHAFEILRELKREGKIRHIGISFHDTADVLDRVLSEQPDIEVVQLQINYLDSDDPGIQSLACYRVAEQHGRRVMVMEPVKGGQLVNLPSEAAAVLDGLGIESYASLALRYATDFPNVFMVLSGMGNVAMIKDNVKTMKEPKPLSKEELAATDKIREIIRRTNRISCTGCSYCTEVCPKEIKIPDIFAAYNRFVSAEVTRAEAKSELPATGGAAADCIGCGACEGVCPQGIEVRKHLGVIAKRLK